MGFPAERGNWSVWTLAATAVDGSGGGGRSLQDAPPLLRGHWPHPPEPSVEQGELFKVTGSTRWVFLFSFLLLVELEAFLCTYTQTPVEEFLFFFVFYLRLVALGNISACQAELLDLFFFYVSSIYCWV